jgi:hypothetical protein
MDVALQLIFQNYGGTLSDAEHTAHERRVAELAEPLGFDKVLVVEHYFFDYAACPDNAQFLSWPAARTERIGLGTGAFILPWKDPSSSVSPAPPPELTVPPSRSCQKAFSGELVQGKGTGGQSLNPPTNPKGAGVRPRARPKHAAGRLGGQRATVAR